MVTDFKFPDVGEGITEGEVVKWRIKEGEKVKVDQALVEVETDKAIVELPSPRAGTVLKIHHGEGDTVKVGEILVTIGEETEKIEKSRVSTSVVGILEEAPASETPKLILPRMMTEKEVLATPATRRLAKELGVDIGRVTGTGIEGRVTEEDVRRHAGQPRATEEEKTIQARVTRKYDLYGYVEHVPLKGIRRTTAKRMIESKTIAAHVTHMDEADVTTLVGIREHEKKSAAEKGLHLTYLPFIVKAVVAALREHPYLNSTLDDENEEIILKKYYNIGIAVDIPDGLIVPVIKGADQKSILELAREIEDLAKKAAGRELDLADLKGGTFTITNVGIIGGNHATPIINYPEVAILAIGRIQSKPLVWNGKIEIRQVVGLSLSFDHRVVDGAEAARFMNAVILRLVDPDKLLLE
ncbi:MAG: dihydrolipoamide acetyltransferase family protein [archaeon]